METRKIKLHTIASKFFYGAMPKPSDICESGYPIFSGYRIVGYSKRANLHEETLIVIARGVGGTGDVKISPKECFLTNLSIAVELDKQKVDIYYLCTYLNLQGLKYLDTGAAQSQITINNLKNHILFLPSLTIQQKIASILSAYDSLIENNKKRIKLLEQMAENLYKEWFVRFRFPGYETAEFEGGVPKGWSSQASNNRKPKGWAYGELKKLGAFVRGKNITSAEMVPGPFPVISAGIEPSGYHNQANVDGLSLTISSSGANAGFLKYNLTNIWAADCSYYNIPNNIWFVYFSLKYIRPVLRNLQCGAAQPHVYPKDVNRLCIILPPDDLIKTFERKCQMVFETIHCLNKQIGLLTTQRDLLLPRLMSGKLSI